jgi:phospholipid/cholesterol/gamma-HCH transport system substrate-binding protein
MNNTQQTARVGLFFLLGLALVWVTFETLSDGKVFKDRGYTVVAGFENLKELKVGDEVRMAGVKVGSVEKTQLNGRRAEAVLRIDPGIEIKNDSAASIVMAGLIGTNYVGLDLGSPNAPLIQPGAEIRTKVTPDINSIMSDLGSLGQKLEGALSSFGKAMGGDGKDGGGLFQKLDKLVTDNNEKITATVTNFQEISAKMNKGEGTLGKLLNDPALHDQLVATVTDIKNAASGAKDLMMNAQAIVDQVKSGKGTLGSLLYDDTAANSIKATVANLQSVSEKLARGEGTLGKLINDETLFHDAQSTLKKADRALEGLGDSGPITAVGVVANSLF